MGKQNMKNMITRDQYKRIKKYDHSQMELFAQRLVKNGIEIGYKAAHEETKVDIKILRHIIGGVKGIGDKKIEDIMKAIEEANICTNK